VEICFVILCLSEAIVDKRDKTRPLP